MRRNTLSRRQLLRGAGGVSLGLPLLPSLVSKEALAQAQPRPRLAFFWQPQGGYWSHVNPPEDSLTGKMELYPGHQIHWTTLRNQPQAGGKVGVSRVLQADPSVLTDRMLSKINLLRGVDHTNSRGHNKDGFGNCDADPTPSVDQLAAWSPSFYKPGEFRERSIVTGGGVTHSAYYSSPLTRTGSITGVGGEREPARLFEKLFMGVKPTAPPAGGGPAPAAPQRPPLVDLLFDSYKSLRDSNRRLSVDDRRRLNDHMEQLSELQRRVSAPTRVSASCSVPTQPAVTFGNPGRPSGTTRYRTLAESIKLFKTYNDIIFAAYKCGITRVAAVTTQDSYDPFSDYVGGWHSLAHSTDKSDPKPAEIYAASMQAFFEHVVLDLAKKLDSVEEVPGRSYLDNTLLFFTHEASWDAHTQIDRMVMTVGNVNGYFKTGFHVDYRNRERPESNVDWAGPSSKMQTRFRTGILQHQWWANVLHALGIPKSEWEHLAKGTGPGYGPQRLLTTNGTVNAAPTNAYVRGVLDGAGNKLPVIT